MEKNPCLFLINGYCDFCYHALRAVEKGFIPQQIIISPSLSKLDHEGLPICTVASDPHVQSTCTQFSPGLPPDSDVSELIEN